MQVTSRSRSGKSKSSSIANRIQLIIFCEGKKTESIYLTHWYRLYRSKVIAKIAPHEHTTPFELVRTAVDQRRADLREARRGRGSPYDQYWCMFDVDEHPHILEALELAKANNINVALSSPCVELWFLLHFDDQTAYIDRHDAQRKSRDHLSCDKVLTPTALDLLVSNYEKAKDRAQSLERKHIGDASDPPWNPYSDAWQLVDAIRSDTAAA
jgi:RloB-like protein